MRKLRFALLGLVVILFVFLNIERLDIGSQQDVVNLQSFVYGLSAVAVFTTLAIPTLSRWPSQLVMAVWILVYLVAKVWLFDERPALGGMYTYLTVTELVLLSLSVVIAHIVARSLHQVEETVANITLNDVSRRVRALDAAQQDIQQEFLRSRRYNRPLSVLLVKIDPQSIQASLHATAKELMHSMIKRYAMTSLVRALDKEMRRSDYVLEEPQQDRLVVLLPETDQRGTANLAERIRQLAAERLGIRVSVGFATFPDKALTFDELVQVAEAHYLSEPFNITAISSDKVNGPKEEMKTDES